MPYRRLPKTDQARIKSLEKAIELEQMDMNEIPVPFRLLNEAKTQLPLFKNLVQLYNSAFEAQVADSRKYQTNIRNARMYISHFIQVLNLAVVRNEIKKEHKLLYKLSPDDNTVPDLTSETSVLEWGQNIIDGEQERVNQGGIRLQNPNIAKVQVYYDIFKESKVSQKIRQQSTARTLQNVASMRDRIDELIKEIWDSVEAHYADLLPYERYMACRQCGIIYYYRKREPELTPKVDKDIRDNIKSTLTLDFSESDLASSGNNAEG